MPNRYPQRRNKVFFYHHEHDDRVPQTSDSTRRVSFKNYGNNRHKNVRLRLRDDLQAALAFHEGDVEMIMNHSYGHNRGRFNGLRNFARRGRGGLRRDSPNPGRKLQESPVHWYKVMIPEGQNYESSYLLGLLASYIKPCTFTPLGYKKQKDCALFYIEDYNTAQQLMRADKKITTSDDWTLIILVRAVLPQVEVTDSLKALMKSTMAGRYNIANKALDLTKFHTDPVIMKENIFCPLNRINVIMAAIQIIGDSIPDLLALNLSGNKLVAIDGLKMLKTSTPNLKVLHLGQNHVRFMDQFDVLQGLQIEELELSGNPLCDKYRDKDLYIRDVQKRFPKVVRLDGASIPPMITFEVEEEVPLIPSQGSFLCDPAAAEVIRPFLQQYYSLYDCDSRNPLVDAYHEEAQFSLSCSHQNTNATRHSSSMAPYLQDSRNMLVVNSLEKRKRLLRRGRANILSYITSLPKTQHDPASLTVDCSVFSPSIIMLHVTGVFRESAERRYVRSFHRSFVIVPVGTGFCIINELLHISSATPDQVKHAFKPAETVVQTPAPAAPVVPAATVVSPAALATAVPDLATQQQMVTTLAMQSGMNLSWAEKCLAENQWDFNRAVFIFTELQKQGKIPAEAFVK